MSQVFQLILAAHIQGETLLCLIWLKHINKPFFNWYRVGYIFPDIFPRPLFYTITSHQSGTFSCFCSSRSEPEFNLTISGFQPEDAGDFLCMGALMGLQTLILSHTNTSIKLDCLQIAVLQLWPVGESQMRHCSPEHISQSPKAQPLLAETSGSSSPVKGEVKLFMSLTVRICSLLQLQMFNYTPSLRKKGSLGQKWV